MIENEARKHEVKNKKLVNHKSTANHESIPCYESVAAQMLKRGMRLGAWAISKGMQEDLTLLKHLSTGRIQGKKGRAKELRAMLESEGFIIPKKSA